MSRARKIVIYVVLAVLVLGHAYDVAHSQEHWPFSPYAMYAEAQTNRTLRAVKIVGVTASEVPREISLNATYLRNTLSIWEEGGKYRRDKIPVAAKSFLLKYNHDHARHPTKSPRLSSIRVYEYVWKLNDHRPGQGQPDKKNLIVEVHTHNTKKKSSKKKHPTTVEAAKEPDVAR